jgi:hypothetical protein
MKRNLFFLLFGIGLFLTGYSSLHAKNGKDAVAVTVIVTDPSGTPIRSAQIKLARQPPAIHKNPETDKTGAVSLNVIPGKYDLFATATDFAPWAKNILVQADVGQTVNVTLQLVCATQSVRAAKVPATASASVTITVTDATGAAVPFAQIGFCPVAEFSRPRDEADESGKLRFKLVPGDYDLVVTSPGFRRWTQRIELKEKENQVVNAILQVGGCLPGPCTTVEPTH